MKIQENDDLMDAAVKLSDYNPGAADAIVHLISRNRKIDPDNVSGSMSYLIILDSLGIYGTDIYVLYNDICMRDTSKMMAVLKATHLELFNKDTLVLACSKQDRSGKELVPVEYLYTKVKTLIPDFDN